MIRVNLQFFGRGGSGMGGPSLSRGGGERANILDTMIIEEYGQQSAENRAFSNEIENSVDTIRKDFPDVHDTTLREVNAVAFGGRDNTETLGIYSSGGMLGINVNYTNADKMNSVYDAAVAQRFHPSRGNKSGVEAVTYHEMGHALADSVGQKLGGQDLREASRTIVDNAYRASNGKGGTKAWAGTISKYAQENYSECLAEAVSDFYCNGSNASAASKAIMSELKKYR